MTNPTQPAEGMPELPEPFDHIMALNGAAMYPTDPIEEIPVYTADQMREYGRLYAETASAKCPRHGVYMCVACRKGEAAPKAPPMPIEVLKAYMVLSHAQWPIAPAQVRQMRTLLDWLREQGIAPQLKAQGFTKE